MKNRQGNKKKTKIAEKIFFWDDASATLSDDVSIIENDDESDSSTGIDFFVIYRISHF